MIKPLITAFPDFRKPVPINEPFLNIAEFYYDTIQGEGINLGQPAAFLRMQNCSLNCWYCDTEEVWRKGNPYIFSELFNLMEMETNGRSLIDALKEGQHLIFTGGSPLLQQDSLSEFIQEIESRYDFIPFMEIENECAIMPNNTMQAYISCWNNSPKLSSSGNPTALRYKPEILKVLSEQCDSWFKFVISDPDQWMDIYANYIKPKLIRKNQIILMPQGATREELEANREMVLEVAIANNVRYCTREHIVLWDKKTGA